MCSCSEPLTVVLKQIANNSVVHTRQGKVIGIEFEALWRSAHLLDQGVGGLPLVNATNARQLLLKGLLPHRLILSERKIRFGHCQLYQVE